MTARGVSRNFPAAPVSEQGRGVLRCCRPVEIDDAHLVTRAQAGRVDAFTELVRRHRDPVYRIALRMLADPRRAEDATQDVLLQAWRSLDSFRGEARFGTWLHRITVNRCLNLRRAEHPTDDLPEDVADRAASTEARVEGRLELEDVRRAVAGLTPDQRAVFVLRELEGCSYAGIAATLEVSEQAVKSRLHRARQELLTAVRGWR